MTDLNSFQVTDDVTDNLATYHNRLLGGIIRAEFANTETITATKELADGDCQFQFITASGANRTVELAPEGTGNHITVIYNSGASNSVVVKDDSGVTTFITLGVDEWAAFMPLNAEGWKILTTSSFVTLTGAQTLTNKTLDGTNNLINNLTADTAPDRTADYVRTYDNSAGSEKKVLLGKAAPVVLRFETFTSTNDPADATTYYFGPLANQGLSTTLADYVKLYVPVPGTITKVEVMCVAVAYGTSETSTLSLRLNNTSDTTITSALTNNALYRTQATGLSVAVVLGDYLTIKWVTPTWVTNPTDIGFVVQVVIE